MKSLCVLRLSALGDCCHALSVVQHLRVEFPDAKLCWIIGKTEYELFKGLEDVEFIIFDKSKRFSSLASTFLKLRSYRFDILLNLHASATANLVSLCVRANRKIGYDSERARDKQNWFCNESIQPRPNQHVADAMMNFVRHLNIDASSASWTPLVLHPEEDLVKANIYGERLTCLISPCSSQGSGDKYNRSWPAENFVQLISFLSQKKSIHIIISGGSSATEKSYSDYFDSQKLGQNALNLIGKTSIREMASLIKLSDFVISPDSGPAHVATIMGKPVIGIYAMSNPDRSGPYNSRARVANRYPEALLRYNKKSVKESKWGKKIKDPAAMELVEISDVVEKVKELIEFLKDKS